MAGYPKILMQCFEMMGLSPALCLSLWQSLRDISSRLGNLLRLFMKGIIQVVQLMLHRKISLNRHGSSLDCLKNKLIKMLKFIKSGVIFL